MLRGAKKNVHAMTKSFQQEEDLESYQISNQKNPPSPVLSWNGVDSSTSAEKAAMLNTFFGKCFNNSLPPLAF